MRKLQVKLPRSEYEIIIKKGIIKDLGENIKKIFKGNKIIIVTDDNVNKHYGDTVQASLEANGYKVKKLVLLHGEHNKCMDRAVELYNEFIEFKLNRGDMVLALGGGVIGDLTGFCASTFLRGIPFIQVPTSLLAQIDSSVGGKVAVDLPQGKNLVGSFYQPKAVYIDPDVLQTLERRYLNDGLSEAIKYGVIKDRDLFDTLGNIEDYDDLFEKIGDIIYNCCDIKRRIVEIDERDTGERMLLNFGHTIGHAIEKIQNYSGYSHGEAVAIGMYIIAEKCEDLGYCPDGVSKHIKEVICKFELPYELDALERAKLIDAMTLDKKNIGKLMNLILIKDIGHAFIHSIEQKDIEKFI